MQVQALLLTEVIACSTATNEITYGQMHHHQTHGGVTSRHYEYLLTRHPAVPFKLMSTMYWFATMASTSADMDAHFLLSFVLLVSNRCALSL